MTHTTYRIWYEQPDACWFAQSPEHPVLSAFGDTPLAALIQEQVDAGDGHNVHLMALRAAAYALRLAEWAEGLGE